MYKLIPLDRHCIVEVDNFPLPKIDVSAINFTETTHISNSENAKRLYYEYYRGKSPTEKTFNKLFQHEVLNKVLPLMKTHPLYNQSTLASISDDDMVISATIFKDQVGWSQQLHTDRATLLLTGVVHITDCVEGTSFYDAPDSALKFYEPPPGLEPVYIAPTKTKTGAFWLNIPTGFHQVNKVTIERNHFLFLLATKDKHEQY
jgi:hypothetical protein